MTHIYDDVQRHDMNTEDLCIRIYLSTSPDWWGRDVHHLVWCEANNILASEV